MREAGGIMARYGQGKEVKGRAGIACAAGMPMARRRRPAITSSPKMSRRTSGRGRPGNGTHLPPPPEQPRATRACTCAAVAKSVRRRSCCMPYQDNCRPAAICKAMGGAALSTCVCAGGSSVRTFPHPLLQGRRPAQGLTRPPCCRLDPTWAAPRQGPCPHRSFAVPLAPQILSKWRMYSSRV